MNRKFYTEIAYILGLIFIALGTALTSLGDLGMSMIVAPAYILYKKLSLIYPFITFGFSEYIFQGILLLLMVALIRKFKISYLMAFLTAIIYGLLLDLFMFVLSYIEIDHIALRILVYIIGILSCANGVALMFKTYITPEVYELFVKEVAINYNFDPAKTKLIYDLASLSLAIVLSFSLFGMFNFVGIKIGTFICAFVNGFLIKFFYRIYTTKFEFVDLLPKFKEKLEKNKKNT